MNTCTPTQDAYSGVPCHLPHTGLDVGFVGAFGLLIVAAGVAVRCALAQR